MTARRFNCKRWMLLLLILSVTVLAACGKSGKYEDAAALMEAGDYSSAMGIYAELGDYEDSQALLTRCSYEVADELLTAQQYQEALSAFQALGTYSDSKQKTQECYFGLGREALGQGDHARAVEYFLQAGDRPDVQAELDRAYYEYGHALFVEGKYAAAQEKFDMVVTLPDDARPHFQYLEDAREFLDQQADMLSEEISCLISQRPLLPAGDSLWEAVSNYVSFQYGSAYYDMEEKTLEITATYYPGHRILQAWKSGDTSGLSEDEKQALQVAEDLVAAAKENSDDPLDIELYLYDWLCEHIVYDSPDMDVEVEEYFRLRQLNCLGALLDGKANCQGYTDAFYLLGNMAGFDVCRLGGTGQWEPHSWNGIILDGKGYIVDVTFGDFDDLSSSSKNYTWFNCAFDPEVYSIDGGIDVFPNLVTEADLSQSYFTHEDAVFTGLDDASYYLLQQYRKHGRGDTHAVVQDMEVTNDQLGASIMDNSDRAGVYTYQILCGTEFYNGDTYLTVQWQ